MRGSIPQPPGWIIPGTQRVKIRGSRTALSKMVAGTGAFLPWMFLRVVAMAGTVSFATLVLGLEAYGQLVTALAVGGFLSPLAGLGLHMRVMTEWQGTTDRRQRWLAGFCGEWLVASLVFAALGVAGSYAVFRTHAPHGLLAGVLGLEVLAASGLEWLSRVALMRGGAAAYARLLGLFQVGRLALLLPLGLTGLCSLPTFAAVWSFATGLSLWGTARAVGVPRPRLPTVKTLAAALRAGGPFVVSAQSYRLQAEFNKPVIAGAGFALAGALGLAQRVIDVAALPILGLQMGLSQRVFAGQAAFRTILSQAGISLGLAGLIGFGIANLAPRIGSHLGADYAPAIHTLVQLAALPALQVLRQTLTLLLAFRERTRLLPVAELPACVAGVVVTLVLVPDLGLTGAVCGLYAGEVVQLCVQAALLRFAGRKRPIAAI